MKERWYTVMAPEELHYWFRDKPWGIYTLRKYEVELLGIKVQSSFTTEGKNKQIFRGKNRLILNNGIAVGGYRSVNVQTRAAFEFRVDSVVELNHSLEELAKFAQTDMFKVDYIEILKNDRRIIFHHFSPDGLPKRLYFKKAIFEQNEIEYKDCDLQTQQGFVGKFYDHWAVCTTKNVSVPSCGLLK